MSRLLLACMLAVAVGCVGGTPPTTSLRVATAADAPAYARVIIDDEVVGSLALVSKRGVALPAGKHRITIEADGFFPFDQEVDATDNGGLLKLDVRLVRIPD